MVGYFENLNTQNSKYLANSPKCFHNHLTSLKVYHRPANTMVKTERRECWDHSVCMSLSSAFHRCSYPPEVENY